MVKIFGNERGNIAAPLMVVVGGISLFLAQAEMDEVKKRASQVREESRKSYLGQQNISAIQQAARLMVSPAGNVIAPVHPDPYIPNSGLCDQGRKLKVASGVNWQSAPESITVRSISQDALQRNSNAIFTSLGQGQAPSVAADTSSTLKVLGWKCNDTQPFLVEGVYVQSDSASQGSTSNQESKVKALLTVTPPPPSSCLFYAKDPAGNFYPSNRQPVGFPMLSVEHSDSAELYLECNNVVTDAEIYSNGLKIADTNSYPLTAASRIDASYKVVLGPIEFLESGVKTLRAVVEQVDGSKIEYAMLLRVISDHTTSCAYRCVTIAENVDPPVCGSTYLHKNWYQDVSPKHYVCYMCEDMYGFDPNDGCKPVGVVGTRGSVGCFAADTTIRLDDGRDVAIQDLNAGDKVWNPILKRAVSIRKVVRGPENKPLFRIVQADRTVRVTDSHPFVSTLGLIQASQLRAGDLILSPDGGWSRVDAVLKEEKMYHDDVWNVELEADEHTEAAHMLVANGVVSGDFYLQQRVQSRPLLESLSLATKDGIEP